jgi:hypothetical protein
MAITSLTVTRTGPSSARLTFTSGLVSPTFYVWRDGTLIATTANGFYDALLSPAQYPTFAVFDDAAAVPTNRFPDHVDVQWLTGGSSIAHYRVEQLVGAAWLLRARITESGKGYYHWLSSRLADDSTPQFRVKAVSALNAAESIAASLSMLFVRYPDPPSVALTYSAVSGKVTIAAA